MTKKITKKKIDLNISEEKMQELITSASEKIIYDRIDEYLIEPVEDYLDDYIKRNKKTLEIQLKKVFDKRIKKALPNILERMADDYIRDY